MAGSGTKSRWGSFLQQAVAGVEARLDNILAEGDDPSGQGAQSNGAPATGGSPAPNVITGPPRSTQPTRANDRLQERLARAVARSTTPPAPKEGSETPDTSRKASLDSPLSKADISDGAPATPTSATGGRLKGNLTDRGPETGVGDVAVEPDPSQGQRNDLELVTVECGEGEALGRPPSSAGDAVGGDPLVSPILPHEAASAVIIVPNSANAEFSRLETEFEKTRLHYQEELHTYVERVDALEAKLRYLSREATDSARKALLESQPGSIDRKLIEKDQQIVQLMEEGQKLASTEQKYRASIKRFRSKAADDEKEISGLKARLSRLEAELESSKEKLRYSKASDISPDDFQKRIGSQQRDIESLRSDLSSSELLVSDLKAQLKAASDRTSLTAAVLNKEAKEDKRRLQDLEDALEALRAEKSLVAERAKSQLIDLREKAERATERARAVELEAKGEVQALEAKLEAMRVRAEEVSSGATGDAQAKLLRQIETLQSQYSTATENWRGIEASLISRVADLERDRDDALQRESEIRKKAREATSRAKRIEDELEEAKSALPGLQRDWSMQQSRLEVFQKRAEAAESALSEAKAELERQKMILAGERTLRGSREQSFWPEELSALGSKSHYRPESPLSPLLHRNPGFEAPGHQASSSKARKVSASPSIDDIASIGRTSSIHRLPHQQPIRQGTGLSGSPAAALFPPQLANDSPGTPLSQQGDTEDALENIESSSLPRYVTQDMVSVSTIGAGPSVQLVERMSAAIRRLESEKVATKEELIRISSQRDDARSQIVTLMRGVESSKDALTRVAELEEEVSIINARYQTTLEMLGEKSELVEELKADVEDVKAMYRDLVERTIT